MFFIFLALTSPPSSIKILEQFFKDCDVHYALNYIAHFSYYDLDEISSFTDLSSYDQYCSSSLVLEPSWLQIGLIWLGTNG